MIYSIEQIKTMRRQITKDTWRYYERQDGWAEWGQPDPPPVYIVEGPDYALDSLHDGAIDHEPDAAFIGAAPDIVDFLLARIEALEAEKSATRVWAALWKRAYKKLWADWAHYEPRDQYMTVVLEGTPANDRAEEGS